MYSIAGKQKMKNDSNNNWIYGYHKPEISTSVGVNYLESNGMGVEIMIWALYKSLDQYVKDDKPNGCQAH